MCINGQEGLKNDMWHICYMFELRVHTKRLEGGWGALYHKRIS